MKINGEKYDVLGVCNSQAENAIKVVLSANKTSNAVIIIEFQDKQELNYLLQNIVRTASQL